MAWDARDDGPACALINCCQERHCMARAAPAAAAMDASSSSCCCCCAAAPDGFVRLPLLQITYALL